MELTPGSRALTACLLLATAAPAAHAARPYRFGNASPITDSGDRRPIPLPRMRATEVRAGVYVFDALVRYPPVDLSETWEIPRAGDVNSLDDVPASSWFTPRLGHLDLSADDLLAGQAITGGPKAPFRVEQVFPGAEGGLLARDASGRHWFVDFDPRGHRGLQTTAGVLANRIFWAFGQNVPEDHVVEIRPDELSIAEEANQAALDALLSLAAAPVEGRLRARASRRLEGTILGPFSPRGVRIDDPNDRVPHENRRALRALRVLGAWVNLQEIRPANTLDVYEGPPGRGFVRHYFLDLGEAFGGYSASNRRYWSGYNHNFTVKDALLNFATAGLFVGPWEDETQTAWPSVGTFEARRFEPARWRETSAFPPIRRSRPEDDYWAAVRLAAFLPAHVEALVRSVGFPDPGAAEYMVDTLLERRRKLVEWAFSRVTPLDAIGVFGSGLRLKDRGRAFGSAGSTQYHAALFDGKSRSLQTLALPAEGDEVRVPLPGLAAGSPDSYLRIEVLVVRDGRPAPRPAEFHLRPSGDGEWRLVGVVH
ncbi:MAG TPA: hypothetical protein VI669_19205 [Vicinamibacteria bacterium]